MGLTGGFADVGGLLDCLYGIFSGLADDGILDKYDEIRREKYWKVIDPVSSGNLQRLWHKTPEDVEKDEFFQTIRKAEVDRSLARELAEVGCGSALALLFLLHVADLFEPDAKSGDA